MSQDSKLFAAARIAARENSFLTGEQFSRLLRSESAEACERLLAEFGWLGETGEREELFAFWRETGTAPAFLACFEAAEDCFNCKCACKLRATGNAAFRKLASPLGRIPADTVFESVASEAYRGFSKPIADALAALTRASSPREIDTVLDAALFAERDALAAGLERKLRRLFQLDADLANLCALLRAREFGESAARHLVPGGTLGPDKLRRMDGLAEAELAEALKGTELRAALGDCALSALEVQRCRKGLPLRLLADESEGVGLQAKYWFRRLEEISRVRGIRNAKRNRIPLGEADGYGA